MSDKFPSKEALLSELKHHLDYMRHLYKKDQQTHTLTDAAFNHLVRDMERIIYVVERNLEIPDRDPFADKKEGEQEILDMFPFVDEIRK